MSLATKCVCRSVGLSVGLSTCFSEPPRRGTVFYLRVQMFCSETLKSWIAFSTYPAYIHVMYYCTVVHPCTVSGNSHV